MSLYLSHFVTGARMAVFLCTETTQKIYRCGAEVDFFSRSMYYNKNYGYPSTSDEGYFFSGTVDNYEFYPVEITIPENFIEFRGFFRDWQSVDCVIQFFPSGVNSSFSPPYRGMYTILFDTRCYNGFARVQREKSIIARLEI